MSSIACWTSGVSTSVFPTSIHTNPVHHENRQPAEHSEVRRTSACCTHTLHSLAYAHAAMHLELARRRTSSTPNPAGGGALKRRWDAFMRVYVCTIGVCIPANPRSRARTPSRRTTQPTATDSTCACATNTPHRPLRADAHRGTRRHGTRADHNRRSHGIFRTLDTYVRQGTPHSS